jgi:hypothetical protein
LRADGPTLYLYALSVRLGVPITMLEHGPYALASYHLTRYAAYFEIQAEEDHMKRAAGA